MINLICTVCPKGCRLTVDETKDYKVSGNQCERGITYGKSETMHPVRTVTSTVRFASNTHPRLSVKTDQPVPKEKMMAVMVVLDSLDVKPPVNVGTVLVRDIAGTGANLVATRSLLN